MTYPVDDAGNVRVDFVWGNFPLQPDQQRVNTGGEGENITTDGNWTVIKETGSSTLAYGWDSLSFPTGDGGGERYQTFEWDNHEIATTGYSNYPSFIPDYSGDGDTGLEAVVPNLASFAVSAMDDAVVAAGLVYASTTTYVGATTVNDGKIKTQSPAAGVKANLGATVTATFYNAPEVPNVVGLTEAAATTALTNAHVTKGAVTTTTLGVSATINRSYRAGGGGKSKIWTTAPHGFAVGNVVTIAGTNGNPDLEGSWTITDVESTTTFKFQTVTSGTITEAEDTGTAVIAANSGKIKSQTPAAGTTVNTSSSVALVKYA